MFEAGAPGTDFLDCAGVTILLSSHNRFFAVRATVSPTGVRPRISRLLELIRLDGALFIADAHLVPPRSSAGRGDEETLKRP